MSNAIHIIFAIMLYTPYGYGGVMTNEWSLQLRIIDLPFSIFISLPLSVGLIRFFIKATNDTQYTDDVFFAFKHRYGNVILTNFLASLYAFLWLLLFIVPGIIKIIEYMMIRYIMAENPAIDRKRAFEVSKALTYGYKWEIFLFGLSFIGWILLGVLTCGVGLFFLEPYMRAVYTEVYLYLKMEALENGTVNQEDFTYNNVK